MKHYSERYIKISKDLHVKVWSENTSYGFRHLAELVRVWETVETAKATYYNRTWECYEYESVLKGLLEKSIKSKVLTTAEIKKFKKIIANGGREETKRVKSELNTIGMIASLGAIFSTNQKESNDWKLRMVKAGLESKGLIMPDDWETLTEDVKEERLNKLIEELNK